MDRNGKAPTFHTGVRDPDRGLVVTIAEERRLFNQDEASETEHDHRERLAAIRALRTKIAAHPIQSITDVVAKAIYLQQLYAETGETLDDAIAAERQSDLGFGLVIARDLLACPSIQPLLTLPHINQSGEGRQTGSGLTH